MEQLKKALKIADICMSTPKNLQLFVNLLNKYIYYFHIGADFVRIFILLEGLRRGHQKLERLDQRACGPN